MRGVSGLDRPAIQWTFAIGVTALIAITTWTGVALVRARRAIAVARADAEQARLERDRIDEALARERAARESFMLQLERERHTGPSTLTLTPVQSRSVRGPQLDVSSPTGPLVQLRLVLPPRTSTDARFTVALRSWPTGVALWSRGSLPATDVGGKPAVVATIASEVLAPGPYELLLTAGNPPSEIAVYEFSLIPPSTAR